jgi:Fe-S cluster assembly ATP-binding protein
MSKTPLIEIKNLHAEVDGKQIVKGLNLTINKGEVHAIMGPNGAGKSTLAYILAGKDDYESTEGSILFNGEDLLEMEPEERVTAGLFLAFQYPVEIPGVQFTTFLRESLNAIRRRKGEEELDALAFLKLMKAAAKSLNISDDMMKRSVNTNCSGGEKKRNEALQMALLEPSFAVLDETDSGLDIDALRIVADSVNTMRSEERGFLVITHYQRLLDYIVPDVVHVLVNGQIVKSGDSELAKELEKDGYAAYTNHNEGEAA